MLKFTSHLTPHRPTAPPAPQSGREMARMAKAFKVALAFLAGVVITWVAAVALGVAYMSYFNIFDRDGGGSMGLIFMVGPFCGFWGGLLAAIITARKLRAS